ncbi:MAG: helix-turn-helix transcriptional regulator [Candidatus Dormibacteraceae bacterium]
MVERKEEILSHLKAGGQASLSELAGQLGMSKQGALRHLEALRAEGLIEFTSAVSTGPGRPEHVYRLAPAAAARFPQSHRELVEELVRFMPAEELAVFFERRATKLEREYGERLDGLDFEARVRELARLATEHGHMAEVVEAADGSLAIRQCNCPIADIAGQVGHPCHHEQEMYGRLLGAEVSRETFIPHSDPACTYVIRPPAAVRRVPSSRSVPVGARRALPSNPSVEPTRQ